MKQFSTLLLLFATSLVFSQTTLAEYNYLSKKYQTDFEAGEEIKTGYILDFVSVERMAVNLDGKSVIRSVNVYKFIETENKRVSALLVILAREDTNYKKYICIPSKYSTKDVLLLAQNDYFEIAKGKDPEAISAYHYLWNTFNILGDALIGRPKYSTNSVSEKK